MSAAEFSPDFFFQVATDSYRNMTGIAPECAPQAEKTLTAAEHDLTVMMGIIGDASATVLMAMSAETVYNLAAAILKHEADTDPSDVSAEELPELIQGSIEELVNRMIGATVNTLQEQGGGNYDATPPISLFGVGSDLGGDVCGMATALNSDIGEITLLFAVENEEGAAS